MAVRIAQVLGWMDYFPGCSSFGQYDIVRVTAVNVTFYFNYFCISKPSIIYPRRNNYCSMRLSAEETKKRTPPWRSRSPLQRQGLW